MDRNYREIIGRNVPLRLTAEHRKDITKVFTEFFGTFDLDDIRSALWFMISRVICLNDEDGNFKEHPREGLLFYYEEIELLIEAVFVFSEMLKKSRDD